MVRVFFRLLVATMLMPAAFCHAAHPLAAPGVTSLTKSDVAYRTSQQHHVVLKRGDVTAIIVDNAAIDVPELPGHHAGYNGVASLTHRDGRNLFVPSIAGLNFEHMREDTDMVISVYSGLATFITPAIRQSTFGDDNVITIRHPVGSRQ